MEIFSINGVRRLFDLKNVFPYSTSLCLYFNHTTDTKLALKHVTDVLLTVYDSFVYAGTVVKMTATVTTTMSMVALLLSGMMPLVLCSGERLEDNSAVAVADSQQVMCEDVRMKCAFGMGCSMALQHYFAKCDRILQTDSTTCPESCLFALVALISTEDGKRMMDVSTYLH